MRNKTLIIAEAGVNHNGDFDLAKKLIDVAALSGADIVKFQTFKAEKIASMSAQRANYQVKNLKDNDVNQFNMLKKLEMPYDWHFKLKEYASIQNIQFLSTPFDEESIDFLNQLDIPFFKVPSGEITNLPYLIKIATTEKPLIISTGMAEIKEIQDAINVLELNGVPRENMTILHCNTEYPTPYQDVNLLAMLDIKSQFGVQVGYSDHTLGIEVPIAAVALGATVIEKHFTLDRSLPGPDHAASLEPIELNNMVSAIRNIEQAISGDGKKYPSESETKNKVIARKSLHYKEDFKSGHVISIEDLISLRPGSGISPMKISSVIGKTLRFDVKKQAIVSFDDFKVL
jgi:N,N'-diacetyllegionaminate synthase